jgi:quinoprotein glucose dehydrogenase
MSIKNSSILIILSLFFISCQDKNKDSEKGKNVNWSEYLGGADRNHYSELTQINAENVKNLKIAWTYPMADSGHMQTNPLIVDGILYGVSPKMRLFALNAETGKVLWTFSEMFSHWQSATRGISYWEDGDDKRILFSVYTKLYAIDIKTGVPIPSFGINGEVDLHVGLPEIAKKKFVIGNTAGTIFEDLIIMPTRVLEDTDAAPGDIRAFNVRTGKLEWTFHTIPYPGEYGYETFPKDAYKNESIGGANCWTGMSVDKKRGIVYVPTGSAAFDFYGGTRKGSNLFSNSLIALDARTGKRIWHFQTTHHDIWDRDLPAPPNLITVKQNGKLIDAVAQITKQGYVFVFDRVTGAPIFPINEIVAPKSDLIGEEAWPTQPVPSKPLPFARQAFQLADNDISPFAENKVELLNSFKKYNRSQFAAPSREGTVIMPGIDGGAEWGGAAADKEGILYVNSNEMPWVLTMIDSPKPDELAALSLGERTYKTTCSQCHGAERKGSPLSSIPSLINIGKKLNRQTILNTITKGKGKMPGFESMKDAEKQALIDFLMGIEKNNVTYKADSIKTHYLPYQSTGYNKFLDNKGHPAIKPPWGTLSAINLNTGDYLWKIPFGNEPNLAQKGTGTENYGGPIVTASGLLIIAATKDGQLRVFDKKTGKLIWETTLPYAAFATPATYMVNGKQYLVLACGGTKLGTKMGNQYVAYALP